MTRPRVLTLPLFSALVLALVAVFLYGPLTVRTADAQAQTQLVPLVTDQTPMALSNQFGIPRFSVVNQSGDYLFVSKGGSALFYRASGAADVTRVFQMGDEVPGYPGSRADLMLQPAMGGIGVFAFRVDFFDANGVGKGLIYKMDGDQLEQIISSDDLAPDGGGAKFERTISLIGINTNNDIAFTAPLVNLNTGLPPLTTIYIAQSGNETPFRIAGIGDSAPGTSGTFSVITPVSFNNNGEVLFRATVVGGSNGQGLFVGSLAGVRKIMLSGETNPGGGPFPNPGNAFLNNNSEVAFQAGNIIYTNDSVNGTVRVVGMGGLPGDSVPAPVNGNLSGGTLLAFGDDGDIALTSNIINSATSNFGLFRFRPGSGLEIAAYRNQAVRGAPGETFNLFSAVSINSTSIISFRGSFVGGSIGSGIFQQEGVDDPTPVVLSGQATELTGGGSYTFADTSPVLFTQTLEDGTLFCSAEIENGTADYAEFFFYGGSPTTLMSTGDTMPEGSRIVLRTFRLGAEGNYVAFLSQQTGGRFSLAVHEIATHATTIIASDGDVPPGASGGRLILNTVNTGFINSSGTVAFSAQMVGGTMNGNGAIFTGAPGSGLTKIVGGGEVDSATGRTFSALNLNQVTPSSINDAGQVVFNTLLVSGANSQRGIFVGSGGGTPGRIASIGQILSDGRTVLNFPSAASSSCINAAGQIAFLVNTVGGGSGIYVGTPGGTPVKVAATGDPGPTGGTFSGFSFPSFNDSGEVAFVATLTGGPGGGVFVGSTSAAPVAVALNGGATPAGGTYSINTTRPDVLINNAHDLVIRANIAAGTTDSAYFIRRGPAGVLHAIVRQGDPAPGTTGGVFSTIIPGSNGFVGENFQLGPDGDVAFQTFFIPPSGPPTFALWHVRTDDSIEEILVRATIAPEFGGGAAVASTPATSWNSGGRFAVFARTSAGTFTDGIFLFVPVTETNTPAGTSVPVTVVDSTTGTTPVTTTFDTVTQAGETTLTTSSGGPAAPTAFSLGDPPVFYNVETTATFAGSINICVDFNGVSFPPGSNLRLLHFENGSWVDVTTSGPSGSLICGSVTSLSPFTVARQLNSPPLADAGADQTITCTAPAGAPVTLNGSGSSDPDHDLLSFEWRDEGNRVVGTTQTLNLTVPVGLHTYTLIVNDGHGGIASDSVNVAVNARLLSALAPANVWLGLKNSDDVGTRFDLLAEVFKDGSLVGSGQLNSVPGGSSGFNNASQRAIPLTLTSAANCCGGGALSIKLSVRIAADSGHRSGTARLWYNDGQANSSFGATIGASSSTYYLQNLFQLGTAVGPGPKKTSDVTVDRAVGGNPFKPFGTWTINFP